MFDHPARKDPPPPARAILPLFDNQGSLYQVYVANKIWLADFVHENYWKLCETFFNLKKKKKSLKTRKTEMKY